MSLVENKQFVAIKSMFSSGSITRMKDIEKLYPTRVAKSLHINHSRYIEKLYKPDGFTIKQIDNLAKLLDVNIQVILDVIIKELNTSARAGKKR